MLQYVNTRGGWTLIGWNRQGEAADNNKTNKTEYEAIASQKSVLHLVCLRPTNMDIVKDKKDFDNLKIQIDENGNFVENTTG